MKQERALELIEDVRKAFDGTISDAGDEVRLWKEGVLGAVLVRAGILNTYFFRPSGIIVRPDVNVVGEDERIFSPERFIGFLASLREKEVEGVNVISADEGVTAIMDLLNPEIDYVEYS